MRGVAVVVGFGDAIHKADIAPALVLVDADISLPVEFNIRVGCKTATAIDDSLIGVDISAVTG